MISGAGDERYYIGDRKVSKQEYLDDGGVPVPEPPRPIVHPAVAAGVRALEVFREGDRLVYYMNAQEVPRTTWLREGLSKLMAEETPDEVDRLERKAFGQFQNYLHNTLGITKDHVEGLVAKIIDRELKTILLEILNIKATVDKDGNRAAESDYYRDLIQLAVVDQLQKVLRTNSINNYVESLCRKLIETHVLSRLKVDIRVHTVNPEEGVNRELVSPSNLREVRDI